MGGCGMWPSGGCRTEAPCLKSWDGDCRAMIRFTVTIYYHTV